MDAFVWKRVPLLIAAGLGVGFGAAMLVEKTDWDPLVAPILSFLAAAAVAVLLRKLELLNFLIEDGLFAYSTFIGMALVRASGAHNYLAEQFFFFGGRELLNGVNFVVALVGIPYAMATVFIAALPTWALAQRSKRKLSEQEQQFWDFIHRSSS